MALATPLPGDKSRFLHKVIDEIVGRGAVVASDDEHRPLVDAYIRLIRKLISAHSAERPKDLESDETLHAAIVETLANSPIPADHHPAIADCVCARFREVLNCLVEESSHLGQQHLVDFDWRLSLAVSSDKLSTVREPLLMLNLALQNNNTAPAFGSQQRNVLLELNKDELDHMIAQLEAANEKVVELRV